MSPRCAGAAVPPDPEAAKEQRTRGGNLRSSIYRGGDGYWHGRVTVCVQDDGTPDRRHVMGTSRANVVSKVRELERGRDQGAVRKAGERWTVGRWLTYWIDNIAVPPHIAENTHLGYRVDVTNHLIPGLGAHRLEKLSPEHVERLYAKLQDRGMSAGGVHHVHRTLRASLNVAVRRSYLTRNPAVLAKAPSPETDEIQPYDVAEIQRLLEEAARLRNGARWALALSLGLRQGETLGLTWDDIDLDKGILRVRRSRLRPRYAHGCDGSCGETPGHCPQRVTTRTATGTVKSRAGRRTVGLPPQLVPMLRAHQAEQDRERCTAGDLWHDEGWVFATETGEPIHPRTDYSEWKRLLKAAGLRDARLHDARHTAATVLLVLRQPTPTVMSLMGWSSESMAARYQHVTDSLRSQVASQVGEFIWSPAAEDNPSLVPVSAEALAAVLAFARQRLIGHQAGQADPAVSTAISQLEDVLQAAGNPPRDSK